MRDNTLKKIEYMASKDSHCLADILQWLNTTVTLWVFFILCENKVIVCMSPSYMRLAIERKKSTPDKNIPWQPWGTLALFISKEWLATERTSLDFLLEIVLSVSLVVHRRISYWFTFMEERLKSYKFRNIIVGCFDRWSLDFLLALGFKPCLTSKVPGCLQVEYNYTVISDGRTSWTHRLSPQRVIRSFLLRAIYAALSWWSVYCPSLLIPLYNLHIFVQLICFVNFWYHFWCKKTHILPKL